MLVWISLNTDKLVAEKLAVQPDNELGTFSMCSANLGAEFDCTLLMMMMLTNEKKSDVEIEIES